LAEVFCIAWALANFFETGCLELNRLVAVKFLLSKAIARGATLFVASISISFTARSQDTPEWTPPAKLCSTDNHYCVAIVEKSLPDKSAKGRISSDYPETEDSTLVVSANGHVLAEYPTFGYLLSAFWRPDGKYVAVNNRRANSGDYLWVISLPNGRAIKVPEELAPGQERESLKKRSSDVLERVAQRFPKCTDIDLTKNWLEARAWKNQNELIVREDFRFFEGSKAFYVRVNEVYRIRDGKFERLPRLDIKHVRELTD
jgi:hypothetical protein